MRQGKDADASLKQDAAPRLFIRVVFGDGLYLGPGKIDLLEHVERTGSIAAAGKAMGMSYKRAWGLVAEVNGMFERPLVSVQHGGRAGGGAVLTPMGRSVVSHYRAVQKGAYGASVSHIQELSRTLRKPTAKPAGN